MITSSSGISFQNIRNMLKLKVYLQPDHSGYFHLGWRAFKSRRLASSYNLHLPVPQPKETRAMQVSLSYTSPQCSHPLTPPLLLFSDDGCFRGTLPLPWSRTNDLTLDSKKVILTFHDTNYKLRLSEEKVFLCCFPRHYRISVQSAVYIY